MPPELQKVGALVPVEPEGCEIPHGVVSLPAGRAGMPVQVVAAIADAFVARGEVQVLKLQGVAIAFDAIARQVNGRRGEAHHPDSILLAGGHLNFHGRWVGGSVVRAVVDLSRRSAHDADVARYAQARRGTRVDLFLLLEAARGHLPR